LRLSEAERSIYEQYQKQLHQDASMALPYEIGREEGQLEKAREIAKSLKKRGLSNKEIAEHTGLSEEEIEKL
jgi:predicted transposase/invertase (TIGR01784 family)